MKKRDTSKVNSDIEEFDRKNTILLLELFILVFITLLFSLAFKDSKENNSKVIEKGLTNNITINDASKDFSEWLFNNNEYVQKFDVVSFKEETNTCYNFIVKYLCEDNKNDCILIDNKNLSSQTKDGLILSGCIKYDNSSYKIVESCK